VKGDIAMIPQQDARKALIAQWRAKAVEHRTSELKFTNGSRYHDRVKSAHAFSAATFEVCANDLEALSESSGSAREFPKCRHHNWTADRHREGVRRCYLCGASEPAQGSCLICGQERLFAVYHESALVGVCAECRDRARASSETQKDLADLAAQQGVQPIHDLGELAADVIPDGVDIDADLAVIRQGAQPFAQEERAFTCVVRRAGKTDPPQDCDWPFCGCDEHATKVIATLQECGWGPNAPSPSRPTETPNLKLRTASESVGWLNSEGPLSTTPSVETREG
jgi:hypothetical protein